MFVSSMMASVAMTMGYTAIFLPQLRNVSDPLYMDDSTGSWYASINNLASPLGSLAAGIVMDHYGRRISILVPIIPIILLWSLTALAQSTTILFFCRTLIGFFTGFVPVTCQIYLAECTDPMLRSFTVNIGYVSLSIGLLVVFALGAFFHWRTIAWFSIVLPAFTLLTFVIIPETPVWLVRNERIGMALKNLKWLRGNDFFASNELNQLTTRFEEDKLLHKEQNGKVQNIFWTMYTEKAVYRPTIIVFLFILFFNISGTYLIVTYAVDIINDLQCPFIDESMATVIMAVIRLAVTILFCSLFIYMPRRKIYLLAGIGSTLSTTALVFYIFADFSNNVEPSTDACIKGILMATYVATNTGFQITPGFMIGELLPVKMRGRIAGFLYTAFSIIVFIITKLFVTMRNLIGIDGILVVWTVASFAATLLIYFTVPETKGKSLDEIEDYFRHGGWIYRRRDVRDKCKHSADQ